MQVGLNALEKRFGLPTRTVAEHLTDLMRSERAGTIGFSGDGFEHTPGNILPTRAQRSGHVFRNFNRDVHGNETIGRTICRCKTVFEFPSYPCHRLLRNLRCSLIPKADASLPSSIMPEKHGSPRNTVLGGPEERDQTLRR